MSYTELTGVILHSHELYRTHRSHSTLTCALPNSQESFYTHMSISKFTGVILHSHEYFKIHRGNSKTAVVYTTNKTAYNNNGWFTKKIVLKIYLKMEHNHSLMTFLVSFRSSRITYCDVINMFIKHRVTMYMHKVYIEC